MHVDGLYDSAGQVGPCSLWFNDLSNPQHKDAETVGQALFEEPAQGWSDIYAINVHSIYFVTTAFLGLLEAGTKSRPGYLSTVINTTSISGLMKLAQEHVSNDCVVRVLHSINMFFDIVCV